MRPREIPPREMSKLFSGSGRMNPNRRGKVRSWRLVSMFTDELFTKFKQQSYAEHANHILKGPLAVRPVFQKSAHRVEALVFLLLMSLTLYFVLQRTYRETCEEDASAKERRTTTRTILSEFAVFTVLVTHAAGGRIVQPLQPNATQRDLLQRLGLSTPAQILSRRLPRSPA